MRQFSVTVEDHPIVEVVEDLGAVGRLLRRDDLTGDLLEHSAGIVAELCKNHVIFCNESIRLWSHVLSVLSVSLASNKEVDFSCLECLSSWFWSKSSVSFFVESMKPILTLIQAMRRHSYVVPFAIDEDVITASVDDPYTARQARIRNINGASQTAPTKTHRQNFLTSLMEWVGAVETRKFTEHCINVLFCENVDVLLFLCSYYFPGRGMRASFFYLVEVVIRSNLVQCEAFARKHAIRLLLRVLRLQVGKEYEESRAEMLQHATRVVVKLTRSPRARQKFLAHGGFEFFGSIARDIFLAKWRMGAFPRAAAQNVVLACSFMCEFLVAVPTLEVSAPVNRVLQASYETASSKGQLVELVVLLLNHSSYPFHRATDRTELEVLVQNFNDQRRSDSLSILETLVLFLSQLNGKPVACFDSFDRLAATILAALAEKLPSRVAFEYSALMMLDRVTTRPAFTSKNQAQERVELRQMYLTGLRRCLKLTKWAFESDLTVIRRTYLAWICEGVRTGVVPAECRNVCRNFDRGFLVDEELVKTSASSSTMPSMASMGQSANDRRGEGLTRSGSVDNGERIKHDEEALLAELQELVEFVEQHEQVVKTLTENRKKSMNGDIQAADTSARVLCAMHSTLSIALDWYVDVLDSQKQSGDNPGDRVEAIERFQTWLKLMEELGGVLCCRLHDLDREYYSGLIDKFHAQITEFPAFLQKAEGRQSRGQSVVLFFWNLNSILKRIINKHELKGVAANDFLLAGEAKRIYDLLREQEAMMLSTVSELLQSKQAQDQMVRLIISMNYVWQRVVGSATISESLAGVKSSVGLLATIKKYFFNLIAVLLHPLPFLRSKWEHLHELLGKLAAYFGPAEHHALDSTGSSARVLPDAAGETSTEHEARIDRKTSIVHISTVPFTSNELLLDHFGFASLSAKKTKQLLNLNEVKEGVLEDLRATLNKSVDSLTQLSVIQLDKEYQSLSPDMLYTLITSLRQRVNATDSGIEVPVVQREAFDVNFWRFLIRPVQRARLFNLYYLVQNFINEDADGRGGLMDEHQQHLLTEIHGHRKQAVTPLMPIRSFRSTSTFLRQGSTIGLVMKGQSVGGTATSRSKTGKRLKLHAIRRFYMAYLSREALRRRLAIFTDSNNADTSVVRATSEFITDAMLHVCDHITAVDPFSDAMAIELLRRTVLIHRRTSTALELEDLVPSTLEDWISRIKGCIPDRIRSFHIQVSARVSRNAKVLLLMLAFWRHEELEADLNNKSLAKVFNNDERERKDYFVSFHLRKAFAELIRVWMPESGTLGIPFWHSPWYSLGGGLLCFLIAVVLPLGYTDAELRYRHMNVVLFVHVGVVFALCAISIIIIALKHFVLQERNRLRLTPITTYYSNGLAIVAIMVEIVQLNSLSFDSTIKWNDTDQIPKLIQLLGNTGITNFGISQVTLKALVCFLTLLVWFILLKCANKFQKNGFLNRLLTKDLPSILNGMLYMGMISIFFSFLACVDCQGRNSALFDRCVENPKQVPFLLNHQLIECWSREHMLYALLGLWGITFFLPIGLLAQGMSQVLFQQEILDVKYAPLVLLMGQLIKAFTATAKAFFSFDPLLLASIGLGGNALLLLMMLLMKSTSIWFIKYIKCGIYSASCWSACCAILRLQSTSYSARSMNLIYIGWLSIGAITAATIMWNVYRRGEIAHKEQVDEWETQRRLMISITRQDAALTYTRGEARFMTEAKKRATKPSIRSSEFMRKAGKLSVDEPPQELDDFVRRAKTFASTGRLDGGKVASKHEVAIMTASNARFMQNARRLAKKIETNELRESEIEALNNKKTK
ncbi:TPA: hypothetical protein N0F65_011792 [Lagenidium giganteum]|uniref:Uncharacterized protein n=1 Tax=Lagenidium giganteum TaxID=4803 RepID=A0AAV2YT79_9STRA|nr:TPA: hypothetical protein N0F65_011792 [Lagenidium giganteum]